MFSDNTSFDIGDRADKGEIHHTVGTDMIQNFLLRREKGSYLASFEVSVNKLCDTCSVAGAV